MLDSPPAPVKVVAPPAYESKVSTRDYWSAQIFSVPMLIQAAAKEPRFAVYLEGKQSVLNRKAEDDKELFDVPGVRAVKERRAIGRGR